ncbi:MAG: hypothetical protein ACE15D_10165 [Candidatus Eisenbacteria bacterium]|nr:hypothetical protein [Candidatus Eisenbacteria bacterium]
MIEAVCMAGAPTPWNVPTLQLAPSSEDRAAATLGTAHRAAQGRPFPGRPLPPGLLGKKALPPPFAPDRSPLLQSASTTRTTAFEATLTTADGDRVTLSGQRRTEFASVTYRDASGGGEAISAATASTDLAISVQGDLDPAETAGIRLLLRDLLAADLRIPAVTA